MEETDDPNVEKLIMMRMMMIPLNNTNSANGNDGAKCCRKER